MGILINTLRLFSKPVEMAKQAMSQQDGSIKIGIKDKINSFIDELKKQREALKNVRQTNYNLGLVHYYKGNYSDSRLRFNLLKWFKHGTPELDYFIGRSYYEEGKSEKAKKYLTEYMSSSHTQFKEEAEFTLKIIEGRLDEIKSMPSSLISHYFDLISPVYNQLYIESSAENPQNKLFSITNKFLVEKGKPYGNKILDLGCGTGIFGKWARQNRIAATIVGIDLSPMMIGQAKDIKVDDFLVYNELKKADALAFLKELVNDSKFDLFFASKLFSSEPKIEDMLNKAFEHAEDKAIFALSVKTHENPADFKFYKDVEEFIFNKAFVIKSIGKKWTILHQEEITFVDGDVGLAIILQKVS